MNWCAFDTIFKRPWSRPRSVGSKIFRGTRIRLRPGFRSCWTQFKIQRNIGRRNGLPEPLVERRVQTVREMLVRMGVDPAKLRTEARGDELPVQDCAASAKTKKALEDCLLPNRRVEVLVESIPAY